MSKNRIVTAPSLPDKQQLKPNACVAFKKCGVTNKRESLCESLGYKLHGSSYIHTELILLQACKRSGCGYCSEKERQSLAYTDDKKNETRARKELRWSSKPSATPPHWLSWTVTKDHPVGYSIDRPFDEHSYSFLSFYIEPSVLDRVKQFLEERRSNGDAYNSPPRWYWLLRDRVLCGLCNGCSWSTVYDGDGDDDEDDEIGYEATLSCKEGVVRYDIESVKKCESTTGWYCSELIATALTTAYHSSGSAGNGGSAGSGMVFDNDTPDVLYKQILTKFTKGVEDRLLRDIEDVNTRVITVKDNKRVTAKPKPSVVIKSLEVDDSMPVQKKPLVRPTTLSQIFTGRKI
jgi:hypothetical protein